jgi:uncharacterized damage-inducible protein DinB
MTSDHTAAPGGNPVVPGSAKTANTQPAARSDVPVKWDDRTQLTTLLDYARATVHAKCAGISEQDARRAPLPTSSLMTISGLVSHLRWVEHGWFEVDFLGEPYRGLWTKDDPDRAWRIAVDIPIAQLLADYESACARSRETAMSFDLDAPSKKELEDGRPFTLRYALLHLLEETSRHNGHLDILRELADGVTGA